MQYISQADEYELHGGGYDDEVYFDFIDVVFHTSKLSEDDATNFDDELASALRVEDAQYYQKTDYSVKEIPPDYDCEIYGVLSEGTIEDIFAIACKYDVDYTEVK